jgi:hypothetical protein
MQFVDALPGTKYVVPAAGTRLSCAPGAKVAADGSIAYCCKT